MRYFLAGDIGGTKTLLQVFKAGEEHLPLLRKSYASAAYSSLEKIVEHFLLEAAIKKIDSACFALAAPVSGRKVKLTNLPWVVDADALAACGNIERVSLINDFAAVGLGIPALDKNDLLVVQQGEVQPQGICAIVGAGTGLGVAWLGWSGSAYAVHASEGGHMDFAPLDELQYELLKYLQLRHGHVSYERIVSGPGLLAIYEFLRDGAYATPSTELVTAMQQGDAAAAIASFAVTQQEPVAVQALEMFMQIYGAFVGNVALLTLPRGGVYLAGGIAAKLSAVLQQSGFIAAFQQKGRFRDLLAMLPVSVVGNQQVGLLGASLQAQNTIATQS